MIEGYSPLVQTVLGTSLTWGATALGAAFCFLQPTNRKWNENSLFLDASLGFSAGVMLAASFWSLLQPAIDLVGNVGDRTHDMVNLAFVPPAIGLIIGAAFIIAADYFFPEQDLHVLPNRSEPPVHPAFSPLLDNQLFSELDVSVRQRGTNSTIGSLQPIHLNGTDYTYTQTHPKSRVSNRLWLLLVAITVHNVPEGLAVGVAFGAAVQDGASDSFHRARNLAIGMAIQNFPEGLAVSLPLKAAGYSFWQSFWYGQLSGFVEPIAGLVGCLTVQYVHALQPYALGFAAGAMIFVIFDDVIPEANRKGNGRLVSILACIGFVVMMALDVGFAS